MTQAMPLPLEREEVVPPLAKEGLGGFELRGTGISKPQLFPEFSIEFQGGR